MTQIYLAELTVWDDTLNSGSGGTKVLRYASGLGYNHPSATAYYKPRIKEALQYRVAVSVDPNRAGPEITAGGVRLKNADRAFDVELPGYGIEGHPINILIGDDQADYSTFVSILSGKMVEPLWEGDAVVVRLRDAALALEGPLVSSTFGGTNVAPTGTDGNADDIKGLTQPGIWGLCRNIFPPYVNTSRPIQQLHIRQIEDVIAGFDRGVALTRGASRTFANIDSASDPAAGRFDYHLGGSSDGAFTRLVTTENRAGPITYDVKGDKRGGTYRDQVADIAKEWIEQQVASGPAVVSADVTALNAADSSTVGFWNRDDVTVREALNRLLPSVGAKWWIDRQGRFRMKRLAAPSGAGVLTFRRITPTDVKLSTDADIIRFARLPAAFPPVYKVTVEHQPVWQVQQDGLDANVTQARRALLPQEYRRTTPAIDTDVKDKFPAAIEAIVQTLLDETADAESLRAFLAALLGTRRDTIQLDAVLDAATADAVELLDTVTVKDIFDYGSVGRPMLVLAKEFVRDTRILRVDLWG